MKTTTGQEKISWVSGLRGFGILAVVLGHIATPLTPFIFSWHMPLFVFISGFFIKNDNFVNSIFRDAKRLLFPFFVFSLFPLVVIEPLKRLLFPNYSFILKNINYWEEIKGIFLWMDIGHLHHYGFVLWFLPALFWARALLFLIKRYIKTDFLLLVFSIVCFFVSVNQKWILPFALDKAFLFMPWITIGYLFFNKFRDSFSLKYFVLLALVLCFIKVPEINLSLNTFENAKYCLIYSIVLILSFVYLLKKSDNTGTNKFLTVLGDNSMLILIAHPYTNNFAYIVAGKYWLIEFIISLFCLFIIIWFKNVIKKTKYSHFVNWI